MRFDLTSGHVVPPVGIAAAITDDPVSGRHYTLVREDEAWSVHFPGKALMRWPDDSTTVTVVADERLSEPLLSILLAGPALSGLLIARGATLLHASAVAWPGPGPAVTGFFGPSGIGKTTMARLCAVGGRTVLSDDALRVEVIDGHAVAHRGTVSSRLRQGSPLISDVDAAMTSEDGRHVMESATTAPGLGHLRMLVLPQLSRKFSEVQVRPLPEVEAMTLLSACWPIDGVLDPELVRRQFAIGAQLRRVVEVAVLEVPWGTGREPTAAQVVDALAAHLVPGERG